MTIFRRKEKVELPLEDKPRLIYLGEGIALSLCAAGVLDAESKEKFLSEWHRIEKHNLDAQLRW